MAAREGSLEAPTRYPLDWKSDDFYDEGRLNGELARVFDICHGCRRCVNLCTAFPKLFDLIDESPTGELDEVDKCGYREVVDRCYLCDMCYMSKCPYVPPHPWNLDFPQLMLRAKAVKFRNGETSVRDRLLSSTDAIGRLASIPVVVQMVNAANRTGIVRSAMDSMLGVHKDRELPEYNSATFRSTAHPCADFPVKPGTRTPGKVAIFSTCYVNYNEPVIGHDLLAVLAYQTDFRRIYLFIQPILLFSYDMSFLQNSSAAARDILFQALDESINSHTSEISTVSRTCGHGVCFSFFSTHYQLIGDTLNCVLADFKADCFISQVTFYSETLIFQGFCNYFCIFTLIPRN